MSGKENNQNLDKTITSSDIGLQKVESRINSDINIEKESKNISNDSKDLKPEEINNSLRLIKSEELNINKENQTFIN